MTARVTILGVSIDALTRREASQKLAAFVKSDTQHHVMTPNPEMLVEATKNPAFKELLSRTDLNLPDGAGLLWAARFTGQTLTERVSGIDAMSDLCASGNMSVLLLGAAPGVAEKAAAELKRKNPSLVIAGTYAGSPREEEESDIVSKVNASGARVLFVAYGAPKQDMWIDRNLKQMPGIRLAMGVGGSFDFLAGIRSRAPRFLQNLGLEWFWRLVQEPSRLGRIFTAVAVFPWLVLTEGRSRAGSRM